MAILTTFITSIVEMLILAGVSYGGIRLGKVLRDRKDAKMQELFVNDYTEDVIDWAHLNTVSYQAEDGHAYGS